MKKGLNKLCAIIIVMALLLTSLPALGVYAEETAETHTDYDRRTGDLGIYEEDTETPVISSLNDYYRYAEDVPLAASSSSKLPQSVDNSVSPYFPKIGNQGALGACVVFATTTEPETEPTTQPPTEPVTNPVAKNTVTFTNSFNWSGTISCYYWSDSNKSMTTWPGKAMTKVGVNEFGQALYTFEVPKEATYIIFTNGSSQTTDIPYAGGVVKYYPLSQTDSAGHNLVQTW